VRTYPTQMLSSSTAHSRHNGIDAAEQIRCHQFALRQPNTSTVRAAHTNPVHTQKRSGAGSPVGPL
jgi:hypothetical protein